MAGVGEFSRKYNKQEVKIKEMGQNLRQNFDSHNQSQKLLRLTIFSWKSPSKVLDLLKDTQNFPYPWFSAVPNLEKLYEAVAFRK